MIELDGHEGLWYQQQDMWSKYLRRPKELKSIVFAQFAKMYRGSRKSYDEDQAEDDDSDNETQVTTDSNKFDYIMTHDPYMRIKLPDIIQLTNPIPGESSVMQKRQTPVALRFHKIKQNNDSERYIFGEVMLYCPLDAELRMDQAKQLYDESFGDRRKIEIIKAQVMEHLEGVEEARYHIEMLENELDLEETAKQLDPEGVQDDTECNELEEDNSEYEHLNPDDLMLRSEKPSSNALYKKIEVPGDADLRRNTRGLDEHQRSVLNDVIKYAKDIVKARNQQTKYPSPPFLMMSGGAGAGKSTVIKLVAQWAEKILQQEGQDVDCPCVVITSFCGTAAANVDGQTLHSAFGFSFSTQHRSLHDKARDLRRAVLRYLKLVIIDEVSMVDSGLLYKLDMRLQEITQKMEPFGGIAVLAFGDLMQLPPVMGRNVFEEPLNDEFLLTHRIKPRWTMFQSILLERNHRQGKDKSYAELLNRIRINEQTEEDLRTLERRVRPKNHPDVKDAGLFITALRDKADIVNVQIINKLKGKALKLKAVLHHPID